MPSISLYLAIKISLLLFVFIYAYICRFISFWILINLNLIKYLIIHKNKFKNLKYNKMFTTEIINLQITCQRIFKSKKSFFDSYLFHMDYLKKSCNIYHITIKIYRDRLQLCFLVKNWSKNKKNLFP